MSRIQPRITILAFLCLVFLLAEFFEIPFHATARRKKNKSKKVFSVSEASKFVEKTDAEYGRLLGEIMLADFVFGTNMTDYNLQLLEKANKKKKKFLMAAMRQAEKMRWKTFKNKNATLYRWFKLFTNNNRTLQAINYKELKMKNAEEIFGEARVCPYKSKNKKKCTLTLPDVISKMSHSENPKELLYMWTAVRNETGRKMRRVYLITVKQLKKIALESGYRDYGEIFRKTYEDKDFEKKMGQFMKKTLPLYLQLHAYVRRKLIKHFKNVEILEDGPIPAHLLGNLYAQDWSNRLVVSYPYSRNKIPDVADHLKKEGKRPIDLFIMAETFFVSMGLKRMTPHFWAYSVIEKPKDREVECSPMAYDLRTDFDFRIKMCANVHMSAMTTIHHEMGHIEYYMHTTHLPHIFRESVNDGFHEALGTVISLSASTTNYLNTVVYKKNKIKEGKERNIGQLLYLALIQIAALPYQYIVDTYRYKIFRGSTTERNLNRDWWELRLKYQGVCPPVERTEEDFDAGAKSHVASNKEFMRYLYANVLAFEIHKSLCEESGHKGPLHKCNIFQSKEAGNLLRKVMKLGKSKPPSAVLRVLTNNRSNTLSPEPLLEYFQPLYEWLEEQNEGEYIGWKSNNPMKCPSAKKKKD